MEFMNINTPMQQKIDILKAPLKSLAPGARWVLKSILICLGHLISIENPENLTIPEDPFIIAMNHNCSFETILVPAFLIYLRQGRNFCTVSDWMFGGSQLSVGFFSRSIPFTFTISPQPSRS